MKNPDKYTSHDRVLKEQHRVAVTRSTTEKCAEYREIVCHDIVLITSLDNPLAGRESGTRQEAARWPIIAPRWACTAGGSEKRRWSDPRVDARTIVEFRGWGVIKSYVARGLGVSLVTEHLPPRDGPGVGNPARGFPFRRGASESTPSGAEL